MVRELTPAAREGDYGVDQSKGAICDGAPCWGTGFGADEPDAADRREGGGPCGPGKIGLLEQIDQLGSISAAARAMRMSYRRAWELVDEVGRCFGQPVVTVQIGGSGGGGATLTPLGRDLVAQYRAIERKARHVATRHLARLQTSTAHRG